MNVPRSLIAALALLFAACASDSDNMRAPVELPALVVAEPPAPADEIAAQSTPEPNRYTVFLASDDARAVEAVGEAIERLNGVIGYDAFVWGEGAGQADSTWSITMRLDAGLNEGPAVAVTAGADSWCDMVLSPERALNRYVVAHEIGHCFDFEHESQRDSWMYYAPDHRTDVIPQADVEAMRARLMFGW